MFIQVSVNMTTRKKKTENFIKQKSEKGKSQNLKVKYMRCKTNLISRRWQRFNNQCKNAKNKFYKENNTEKKLFFKYTEPETQSIRSTVGGLAPGSPATNPWMFKYFHEMM